MSPPEKKKNPSPPTPSISILSLPDDLLLSCIARFSRSYYLTLSLVSKRFRYLIASPDLYKARSLLGNTEICLYVCLWGSSKDQWFTLCRKPDKTLTDDTSDQTKKKKKSNRYVLAKVPIRQSPPVDYSGLGLVAVGSNIYNIGGASSSRSVSILDCTTHTWREAPSFPVKLLSVTASVVDRKLYVAGCYKDGDSNKSSVEVLDTETQIWEPIPISWSQRECSFYSKSACINGKFHLNTRRDFFGYDSKEGRWDLVGRGVFSGMYSDSFCAIENVLYSGYQGVLRWYDSEVSTWRDLEGLVGLPKVPRDACIRMADYGGKMAVFWDEDYGLFHEKMIWCAEIAIERLEICKILGKVEWFDRVLKVGPYELVKVFAVTL